MKSTQIRWTQREAELVADTMIQLEASGVPSSNLAHIADQAQQTALHEDRRKSEAGIRTAVYNKKSDLYKAYLAAKINRDNQKAGIRPTPAVTAPPQPTPQVKSDSAPIPASVTINFDELFEPIERQYRAFIRSRLEQIHTEEIEHAIADFATKLAAHKSNHKPKLPKIVVIGVHKGDQQNIIRNEYDGILNIQFTDDNPNRAAAAAKHATAAVLWKNFISHSMQAAVKSTGSKIVMADGGIEAVKDALMQFVV